MYLRALAAAVAILWSASAAAEMKKSAFTASNGVVVDVNSDAFAERYEYSAPDIRFKPDRGGTGFALVGRVKRGGTLGDLNVQGFIMYSGDWRFYNSAIFKGGDAADFASIGRDVGSCRYGCTLTENFMIKLTQADISKHATNGILAIQIRGKNSDTAIVEIPVSYIQAVLEVAK